jgi:hypothetical protein
MEITRKSPISGKINTVDLPITPAQIIEWQNGSRIQLVFPDLTPGQREFIMTGITDQEWEDMFGRGEEE